jgi:rubrerythrin
MFSLREIIDIAIQIEKNGENYYREALENISDPSLEPLLIFLADQERDHARWFEDLKQQLKDSADGLDMGEMSGRMLQSLVGDQKFSLDEVDFSELDYEERLVEVAIELEKDTIIFYQMLQEFIHDPDTLEGLNKIIAEEKRHIEILNEHE